MKPPSAARASLPIPYLRPGNRVQVIAPSSPFNVEDLQRGLELLSSRYQVSHSASLFERHGFLAGTDARRLAELQSAVDDPQIEAILPARGGYGATRLLADLKLDALRERPKLLMGFSDITALHAVWSRAGLGSIHGPMAAAVGRAGDAELARVIDAIEGRFERTLAGLRTITSGRALGRLLGGNLAVLCSLLGTPFMPDLSGAVLLLEDVGERPYRVDRMLTSLRLSGVLDGIAGILLGAFTNAEPAADGITVDDVLADRLGSLGVPVLAGAPIGHIDENTPVPLGALIELDAASGTARFTE